MFNHESLLSFIDIFVLWRYCKKCFIIKEIRRKAKEAVVTVPHQNDGNEWIPAHTHLKQGVLLPLGHADQASRDFYSPAGRVDAHT